MEENKKAAAIEKLDGIKLFLTSMLCEHDTHYIILARGAVKEIKKTLDEVTEYIGELDNEGPIHNRIQKQWVNH